MIIRLADERDNEHIFKIWQACFTDDEAYIDNYLKFCRPYTKTWLLAVDTTTFVSCLSIIPSFVNYNNDIIRGGYLYAVGTLPEHRGNSFSKILMNTAIKKCVEEGFSYLIVKPADEKLFSFYIKSSFDKVILKGLSTINTLTTAKQLGSPVETIDLNAPELYVMRGAAFLNTNFLWCEEVLNYAILEAKNRGGSCKIIKPSFSSYDRPLYFIAYPDELCINKIKVLETNAKTTIEFEILISSLKQDYLKMEEMVVDFPANYLKSQNFSIQRSALLLIFNPIIASHLEKFHLSLPLE